MMPQKNVCAIVLAAGRSSRMGMPKFSLMYDDATTFIEKIADEYFRFGCNDIVIVMNNESILKYGQMNLRMPPNARVVLNDHPEWARFYSLRRGAESLPAASMAFVSNIDNPFISQETLAALIDKSVSFDYVYPAFEGKGGHPFLISQTVLKDIREEKDCQVHLRDFLSRYSTCSCDVEEPAVLFNINTPEEYMEAIKRLRK